MRGGPLVSPLLRPHRMGSRVAMHQNKIYAGIGSRETPSTVLVKMFKIGNVLAQHGWTLRSGHAPGADQAFEKGALAAKGKMEIYLPWAGFEGAPRNDPKYIVGSNPEAEQVAAQFHPAWHHCKQGARKLHTRNVYQVAGIDLDTAADMVICWTVQGLRGGGTGQALRIAEHLKIPIFDLALVEDQEILDFVNHGVIPE